jgi:probable rRNA maturation factor
MRSAKRAAFAVDAEDEQLPAIQNRQRSIKIATEPLERYLRCVKTVLGLRDIELTIGLVSDAEIARMNKAFRGKRGPTDVLSFPAVNRRKPVPLAKKTDLRRGAYLGDIAISPATAKRNARKLGRKLPSELQILMLHGMLHLLGFDHETDHGEMDRLEKKLRKRLGLAR